MKRNRLTREEVEKYVSYIRPLPSVNPQEPTTTVLQEIRQEIDSHGIIMQISNGEKIIGENIYIAKAIVLEIIDKHISGKEQK